ncbi:Jasmonoyl--L-amino acid synthetase JAR1 [Lamellibrachia satsuma]|nr:Jasmonoyl--L-amino acid synthetase JAR1 [Lamellibrachia satsuma]
MTLLAGVGSRVYNKFITSSKRVHSVQEALLLRILQHNKDTVYGTEHDFSSVKTRRDFTETQPLMTYADLKPYFDRIQDGEQNVLTKDPVIFLALSSGTTGKNKVIPITSFMRGPAAYDMAPLMYYIRKKKAQFHMQRVLVISYKTRVQYSKCGLPVAPVTTHTNRYFPFVVSPRGSYEITNEQVALHVHAVFALGDREVGHIESVMSTLVYSFWIYIEHNWQQLCSDIELGRLSLTTDQAGQEIITQLNKHLRPNPARATELRVQFRSSSFHGIARQIWPNLRFVSMVSTGSCAHHAKALRDCHMSGVIQVSLLHAASEGILGINVFFDPDNFNYVAMISYGFMEFIPEDLTHEQQPATLFAEQLQKDNLYEIVLTTPIGIYRYRTGDVVKVVDHLHQCPIYEFQYRLGQLLNLYWEKTPECVFYSAVERVVGQLGGVTLVDYSATEDPFVQDIDGRHGYTST